MRDDLIARAEALENDEDAWTWLDHDPDVAYRDPDSYHGKIVALAEEAGWERCYHRDGAKLHFNVKLRGPGIYRGLNDTIASFGRDDEIHGLAKLVE